MLEEIEAYLVFASLEKGLAENTVLGYQQDIQQFASFVTKIHRRKKWSQVDAGDASDWILH